VRSAGARTTLSAIQAFYDRDWSAAEAGFKRAIEIDAKYATAWQWYGVYGIALGRLDEGLNALRHATECDPLSLMANTQLACGLYLVRRYEEAKQLCDLALEIDPNCWPAHYFLGLTYQQQNLFAQAVRELRHAEELSNGNALAVAALAHVYGQAGSQLDARKILLQLHQGCSGYVSEWALALVYAGLGEREPALSALAQSIAAHSPQSAMFMSGEPRLDGLRSDPRFRQMQSVLYGQASLG
jgi:tetratricopeptide (TPR) repeat protein